ncbi:response regulator [Alkalibacillus salilacus]|uniref:Two-component system chemotaxis response regulator CheY n=1 Tax=Alkalibacillus salilacus TaxID=284582 RepID=A0ABT9VD41_9BACI|nr:response regulator [Alkalibacillus salilacus]MDQ0158858.1 two-component system chemotaxis response regulator CheY [Alkalibacillus salilacus]
MNTVLIADDSKFMRRWITSILNQSNQYKVVAEASCGASALNQYLQYLPDFVILDLVMDDLNGLDVLKEILQENPKANVIICSSMGQDDDIDLALNCGAKDYIVKPNFNSLIPTLNSLPVY